MKVLIDIPISRYNDLVEINNLGFGETLNGWPKIIANGTPILKATNGDIVKAIFGDSVHELEIQEIETAYCGKIIEVIGRSNYKDPNIIGGNNKPLFSGTFKAEWWNAPYKESEDKE